MTAAIVFCGSILIFLLVAMVGIAEVLKEIAYQLRDINLNFAALRRDKADV